MKKCVIVFDCHGSQIKSHFENSKFIDEYEIHHVSLNPYVNGNPSYINLTSYTNNDLKHIQNADLLILQIIEKDRGFLNNDRTIQLNRVKTCKVLKIPHYRFNGYHINIYGYKDRYALRKDENNQHHFIKTDSFDTSIHKIKCLIDTYEVPLEPSIVEKHINSAFEEFQQIDEMSDIKMYQTLKYSFRKYKMFKTRGYPSSYFFYNVAVQILKYLDIEPDFNFIDTYFSNNIDVPIMNNYFTAAGFEFENLHYIGSNIPITNYEWYYLHVNSYLEDDRISIDDILKLIRTK